MRHPLDPIHVPTGSTAGSLDSTAIFDLTPGSRATDLIEITPSLISGISLAKRAEISSGHDLETIGTGNLPSVCICET